MRTWKSPGQHAFCPSHPQSDRSEILQGTCPQSSSGTSGDATIAGNSSRYWWTREPQQSWHRHKGPMDFARNGRQVSLSWSSDQVGQLSLRSFLPIERYPHSPDRSGVASPLSFEGIDDQHCLLDGLQNHDLSRRDRCVILAQWINDHRQAMRIDIEAVPLVSPTVAIGQQCCLSLQG